MEFAHRRGFLATAVAGLTGCAVASPLLRLAEARIEPIGRTRPSHLKLSLAAYSFRDRLQAKNGQKPTMDLFDFVDFRGGAGDRRRPS